MEWKRSVEFWIGGGGSQLPEELVGPRMMVQLKERAAQLVKHLSKAGGKDVIFKALEKSPLIRQSRRSMESYVTRASGREHGDGRILLRRPLGRPRPSHEARPSHGKTKAGSEADEYLVTNALIELASELEGEQGYPIGASEPNAARNGEEWLLQRGDGRPRLVPNKPPRGVFAAEYGVPNAPGEEDLRAEDLVPP